MFVAHVTKFKRPPNESPESSGTHSAALRAGQVFTSESHAACALGS